MIKDFRTYIEESRLGRILDQNFSDKLRNEDIEVYDKIISYFNSNYDVANPEHGRDNCEWIYYNRSVRVVIDSENRFWVKFKSGNNIIDKIEIDSELDENTLSELSGYEPVENTGVGGNKYYTINKNATLRFLEFDDVIRIIDIISSDSHIKDNWKRR